MPVRYQAALRPVMPHSVAAHEGDAISRELVAPILGGARYHLITEAVGAPYCYGLLLYRILELLASGKGGTLLAAISISSLV